MIFEYFLTAALVPMQLSALLLLALELINQVGVGLYMQDRKWVGFWKITLAILSQAG